MIVLVITIIVIIILAAAVILTISQNNPISNAKQAVLANDEAALKEAATLAYAEWYTERALENNSVEEDPLEYVKEKLLNQGFNESLVSKLQIDSNGNITIGEYATKKVTIDNVNLYNKDDVKVGYYLLNNKEGANANYMSTGYIEVNPGDEIYWCAYVPEYEKFDYELVNKDYLLLGATYLSTYNQNQEFIETLTNGVTGDYVGHRFDVNNNNEPKPYIVPEGVKYLRLCCGITSGKDKLIDTIFICKNEAPKYYAEYNQTEITINDLVNIYMPEKIEVAVGTNFNIYNTNICPSLYDKELTLKWESDIGTKSSSGVSFNPTNSDIGKHTATVYVYDDLNNLLNSKSINIEVVENTISNNMNMLVIGDSLSNGKPWIGYVEDLSQDKISITASAISGASSKSYYTLSTIAGKTNPFYNEEIGTFDYNYYLTQNNVSYDSVILFLGTNDMGWNDTNYPTTPTVENIKLKSIVDKIKEQDSSLPIYVVTPMTTVNDYQRTRTAFNFMKDFYSTFGSYTNVKIVPVELTVDQVSDFGESDKIHPLDTGYTKIANAVYSAICANQ